MHRLIVTSATYRQIEPRDAANCSSATPRIGSTPARSRFRMPSLLLRDWRSRRPACSIRGSAARRSIPISPTAIWEALAITKERDFTYPASSRRGSLSPQPLHVLAADGRPGQHVRRLATGRPAACGSTTTSTPLHALTTLNDPTWVEAARVLAERSLKAAIGSRRAADASPSAACSAGTPPQRTCALLRHAYDKQLGDLRSRRRPQRESLLSVGRSSGADESLDVPEHAALSAVCLAIFNLDEALTRE